MKTQTNQGCNMIPLQTEVKYTGSSNSSQPGGPSARGQRFLSILTSAVIKLLNQATGPLNQATGPPQSDAGVGIGMLRGAGNSLT